ncbi:MAG: six-hairpin glycosidase-like protein [Bacteroidales bacterium]|nr:six-hairpin glycosidase-like protein [Bacteroidales bacterium]
MKYNKFKAVLSIVWFSIAVLPCSGQNQIAQSWEITSKREIQLDINKTGVLPYSDNIEMAGKRVAAIVSYSIDENRKLELSREVFFPQLHQFKTSESSWFHDYRAYLQDSYSDELLPKLYINKEQFVPGPVESVTINGVLTFKHKSSRKGLSLERTLFPSTEARMFIELWSVTNTTNETIKLASGNSSLVHEDYGARGKFTRRVISDAPDEFVLDPGQHLEFSIKIMAMVDNEEYEADAIKELAGRQEFLKMMSASLQLSTPDPVINTLFEFSKIRAAENIFESRLGLIHSPGGGRYYVGIWANDQAEYINPFFPYLGYDAGNESAINCFRAFAGETNPEYSKIRYAFEIEGLVKPFLKDRGDAAMIAYGASHFAMAYGSKETALELWPLIEWCLEYCHRQLNDEGVVKSESDEMEGRIETGSANLSTSSLYYGALNHAIDLGNSMGINKSQLKKYRRQTSDLEKAIENYFGAKVEGLDTYKYYKEHKHLRHWICLPLVVGIQDRKDATIEALFERLWTDNGVHVEKNSDNEKFTKIFWDRGTLYALRGTFIAGATEESYQKLKQFSEKRLIGDHVPYVVEAYPEGNMAHLSAESGLYCRVITEGIFGMYPTGLRSFRFTPRLPESWDNMSLDHIKAFDKDFNIAVSRDGDMLVVNISGKGKTLLKKKIKPGQSVQLSFD